jgi:hypothetical protein
MVPFEVLPGNTEEKHENPVVIVRVSANVRTGILPSTGVL